MLEPGGDDFQIPPNTRFSSYQENHIYVWLEKVLDQGFFHRCDGKMEVEMERGAPDGCWKDKIGGGAQVDIPELLLPRQYNLTFS